MGQLFISILPIFQSIQRMMPQPILHSAIPTPGRLESKRGLSPLTCFHETKGAGSWLVGALKLGCSINTESLESVIQKVTQTRPTLARSRQWSRLIWAYEESNGPKIGHVDIKHAHLRQSVVSKGSQCMTTSNGDQLCSFQPRHAEVKNQPV